MKPVKYIVFILLSFSLGLILFAQTQSGLKFNHAVHADNEIECATCHGEAENSNTGKDNLIPAMDVCADCHDIESEDQCMTCHTDLDNNPTGKRIEAYSEKFSHAKHIAANLECNSCHKADSAVEMALPGMTDCQSCHASKAIANECSTCHTGDEDLKPANHAGDFIHTHGQLANAKGMTAHQSMNCTSCHQKSYCQDCHQGENVEKLTHPVNYEFLHSMDARGKERTCTTCHTDRSFCVTCHAENNVMPHNHRTGWINAIPGDGGLHKQEARMDLESCMACHESNAAVTCQRCHGN